MSDIESSVESYALRAESAAVSAASECASAAQQAVYASQAASAAIGAASDAAVLAAHNVSAAVLSNTREAQSAAQLAVSAAGDTVLEGNAAVSSAASQAALASGAADDAFVWAEGTDSEVQSLGGEKSAKGWASVASAVAPTVGSATITIMQGGVSKGSFNVNATQDKSIELDSGGGGLASAEWGSIVGDISSQADLSAALASKQDTIDASHKLPYSNISGAPTIGSGVYTIMQGGVSKGAIDANGAANSSIALDGAGISSVAWGDIQGDITSQADLSSALDGKQPLIDSDHKLPYSSISGTPTIGSATVTIMQGATSKGSIDVNATQDSSVSLAGADGSTITETQGGSLQAVGVKDANGGAATRKIWTGTLAQYTAQGKAQSDDICIITDDEATMSNAAEQAIAAASAAQTLKDQTQALYDSVRATVATYYVGPAYGYGVTQDGTLLSFTWVDPADNDVVKWAKTRLVMKQGGFPANETDGTILVDNTVRNQYRTDPFTYDMGVLSDCYFGLFTQSTGGSWYTGDSAPRFTTDTLTWATIGMMSRAGTLLQYPGMAIGSVVGVQFDSLYPKTRYKLAHIDYTGAFERIQDYMYDNNRRHNSIWIPDYLPCLGEGNNTAPQMQFDAPELAYAPTWDAEFVTGKAYYTVSGETYTQLTEGTDYQDGASVADWQTVHGDTVYTKNNASRVHNGCNSWKESNMRQWLNKSGNDWFVKQNEYDVKSVNADYGTGWLTGIDPGFLTQVMPVYNKTARNTVAAIQGGGGGGYDITLDTFWLPSMKEVFNTNTNNIAEGAQFAYFRDVATTNAQRIQYDEGGTARYVWLRSPIASGVNYESCIATSGSSGNYTANYAYAFFPAVCIA